MPLPNFSVTGNINEILTTSTAGELDTAALTSITLSFTLNIKDTDFILWAGKLYKPRQPIYAQVESDGSITNDGDPILLLANDAGLNVSNLQWQVAINTVNTTLDRWWFDAPADGTTIDLAAVAHVARARIVATPPGGGTATWSTLSGKPAFIGAGDTAAAARAAIGAAAIGGGGTGDTTTNTSTSVVGEAALFADTSGKVLKRATSSGVAKLTSGVLGTAAAGTDYVAPGGALGTPSSGNLANATFPTLNQNTTGSAASLTTPRTIDGQSFNGTANITVVAPGTHAATGKTTPADADELPLVDSAASNVLKKLTWANLKATVKSYYDSVTSTLTNKSVDLALNTLTGTTAQFNTANTDANFYTTAGTDVALADGGTGASLTAPGSDKIFFYDQSAGSSDFLSLGTNLSITGTTINATGTGGSTVWIFMPAPSGDTTGATDAAALTTAQALLPAGRGGIFFGSGVYWLPKDSGNITSGQHWWGSGNGTVLRMAAGQNGNFIRTNGWATYVTSGATDVITATKTGNIAFPGNTIAITNTSGIAVGDIVVAPGFLNGTWVTAITTNTSVTLSTSAQYATTGATAQFSSVPMDWGLHNLTLDGNGYYGFNIANQLSPPAGLTVTPAGTTGTTFYAYRVTAYNTLGETQGSQRVSITNGNATLTSTNKNNLSWTAVTGATGYKVYRAKYNIVGSELLLATVTSGTTYSDQSLTDPFSGLKNTCPMTNNAGGRVLASYGYAFTLEDVDIAYGAGIGWDCTGLPTTNFNFGNNYNTRLNNISMRVNMGGGMSINGPTDMLWNGGDFNGNGATGGGASTNGLVDLDIRTTGLSLSNFHFYGGGVQSGMRIIGSQCMITNGQMEEGFDYLCIITGNFNILEAVTAYNVSSGVDTPCAFYVAGQSNKIRSTIENTAGGIINFGFGENGGDYKFSSSYWSCARPGTPYIGLPHDTRTVFTDLVNDTFGGSVSYLYSNEASYEMRSAATKTVPAVDDMVPIVESGWPYNMKQISYANFRWVSAPATAGAAGVAGQTAYDSGFYYVCVATNTWKRVALATW